MSVAMLLAASLLGAVASPLASERWDKRVVLVFADADGGPAGEQVETLLADQDALAERDMLVVKVVGDTVSAPFGETPAGAQAGALRETYGVPEGNAFTVILVGKDGGEKLRREAPVAAKDVFSLIDSMPMRQREAGVE